MKKLLVVLLCVGAFAIGGMSCKKECNCKTTTAGISTPSVSQGEMTSKECKDREKTLNDAGAGVVKVECSQ